MALGVISYAISHAWIIGNCIYGYPIVVAHHRNHSSSEWAKERSPPKARAALQKHSSSHPAGTAYLAGNINQFVRVNIENAHPS